MGSPSGYFPLGYIVLRQNISPFNSDFFRSNNSDCSSFIRSWVCWSYFLDSLAIYYVGVSRSNPSWGTLAGIRSIWPCPFVSEIIFHDRCCCSPFVLTQVCIPGYVSFYLDSWRFSFFLLLSVWGLLPTLICIWLLVVMYPSFSCHCNYSSSYPTVCNCVSNFTWNCSLTRTFFRDSTSAKFLEFIDEVPKYTPTLDQSDHFWCGCVSCWTCTLNFLYPGATLILAMLVNLYKGLVWFILELVPVNPNLSFICVSPFYLNGILTLLVLCPMNGAQESCYPLGNIVGLGN